MQHIVQRSRFFCKDSGAPQGATAQSLGIAAFPHPANTHVHQLAVAWWRSLRKDPVRKLLLSGSKQISFLEKNHSFLSSVGISLENLKELAPPCSVVEPLWLGTWTMTEMRFYKCFGTSQMFPGNLKIGNEWGWNVWLKSDHSLKYGWLFRSSLA